MSADNLLTARIRTLCLEAESVMSIELVPAGGARFPRFTAGAHIDVHLANGMVRSYSLSNSPEEQDRYVLGVLDERNGRGGSKYIHADFRCGMSVPIGKPRNNFQLSEEASSSILIAGGIGITPILSMYRRLRHLNERVKLVYCCRSRSQAGFVEEILRLGGDIELYFDDEHNKQPVDLLQLLKGEGKEVHAYCCGPANMLRSFESACAQAGIDNVHIERFAADPSVSLSAGRGYVVELSRSGREIKVEPGESLLHALLEAGVAVDYSCEEGVCGSCETRVIAGTPDHRDAVLTAGEKLANKQMMVCVSGCLGDKLTLDL
jgi:ferredoxin-NADP reductase